MGGSSAAVSAAAPQRADDARPLWHSLVEGDWVFAGIDIMCWALALLHAVLAIRTARQGAVLVRAQGKRQAPSVASSEAAE